MIRRIIIAGGGTGGHLFPGLAVVEELRRRDPSIEVLFVGTARGIESRILPARGERLELLTVTPLKGLGAAERLRSAARLPGAVTKAFGIIGDFKPHLVLRVGGYASGPVVLAASLRGIPTALLEQNASVGLTNRMLSGFVGRAYVTFEETRPVFGDKRTRVSGNPVRREFVDASRRAVADPEGFEARANTVLVIGGSQGARALNELAPQALASANLAQKGLRVVHQTGESMRDEVERVYRDLSLDAEVVPFIDDMARAYAHAALVIGRAGATTVAELCAIGRPSILVPFPFAAEDHQTKNARALEQEGAAVCLPEEELSAESLSAVVSRLVHSAPERSTMALAARKRGRPDAAAAIVDDLFDWLGAPEEPTRQARTPTSEPPGRDDNGPSTPSLRANVQLRRATLPVRRRPLVVDGVLWE